MIYMAPKSHTNQGTLINNSIFVFKTRYVALAVKLRLHLQYLRRV